MRSRSLEIAVVVALIAWGPSARAEADACHRGVVEDHGVIEWRSRFERSSALVGPLPDDVELVSIEGGVARREGDRVVGVDANGGGPIVVVTRQSIGDVDALTLRPPLVHDAQRIVLSSRGGSRVSFAPALDGSIERQVGFHATPGFDEGTRIWLDRWCGSRERGVATYVRGVGWDDLRGALVRDAERRGSLLWIGWLVLVVGAVGGVIAWRRLATRAAVERADAMIESRFRALEGDDQRGARERSTR